MKIRNLTIKEDNPWSVTRTWSQWHGDTPVKEWTSEANKYKRKLRKKKKCWKVKEGILLMVGRLSGIDETLRLMRWGNFPELLISAEKGIIN